VHRLRRVALLDKTVHNNVTAAKRIINSVYQYL